MPSAIVFLFRFAVGVAIGLAIGLAVLVGYLPHPRFVIARFSVDLFGSAGEWIAVATPLMLTLMGVWLALQQSSRKARILWVSILLILGVGAAMVNLSLRSQNQIDHALRMMQQDITTQVLTRSAANLERLVTLQRELLATQRKLIITTQSMVQESRNRTMGGRASCFIVPVFAATIPESSGEIAVPVHAKNLSRYPLIGATATIEEQGRAGESVEQQQEHLRNAATINLGDIEPMSEKPIQYTLTVRKGRDNYFHIVIYSQQVLLTELLVVSWNDGRWNADWSLIRTGENQWIHRVAADFPYIERAK